MEEQVILPPKQQTSYSNIRFSLFAGAISGIAAKTCIAPAERIKMSFQVSSEQFSWRKAFDRGRLMLRDEGFLSLWKGHSTTVLRVGPYAGISYMFHDYAENFFKKIHGSNNIPALYKFMAGSIGGFCGTVLTYPLDVFRVRLALGASWDQCMMQGGFFQGILPTILGIIPYSGTAWLTKQSLTEIYLKENTLNPNVMVSLAINTVAGIFGQFVTYPLDVIRRRMQVALPDRDGRRLSFRRVIGHLIHSEGLRGFSKGFSMNIVKGPISLSISLTVFDLLKSLDQPK